MVNGAASPYTVSNVTRLPPAAFAIDVFTVMVTPPTHGSITSVNGTSVNYGDDLSFSVTPDTGYHLVGVLIDAESATAPYNVVNANGHTISANFAISISQGDHGTISPGTTTVNYGSGQDFTFTPTTGYHIVAVIVNGTTVATTSPYTISNVTGPTSLTAEYAINTYAITVSQGNHGTISPETTTVNYGSSQDFTFSPTTGYHIVAVIVNGTSAATTSPYTISNVTGPTSLTANTQSTPMQSQYPRVIMERSVQEQPLSTMAATKNSPLTPNTTDYHIIAVIVNGTTCCTTSPYTILYGLVVATVVPLTMTAMMW